MSSCVFPRFKKGKVLRRPKVILKFVTVTFLGNTEYPNGAIPLIKQRLLLDKIFSPGKNVREG